MDNINLATLAQHFHSEDAARGFMERIRWPNGPVCPHCGSIEAYRLEPKEGSTSPVRKGVFKCKACRRQFTITVGTIFEDSHIPLNKWLLAIYLMCSSKKGMSAHQLHRSLDLTYKSAWFMAHRIRYTMTQPPLVDKLRGIVEADETYVGGRAHGKRGRGADKKVPVFALVERGGRVRSFGVKRVTGENLKSIMRQHVDSGAHIMTDEFAAYNGLQREFASHDVVGHADGEYVRGMAHVNTAESFFSLLKRGIYGTFHHVSPHHLHRYLAEFGFRYDLRGVEDGVRTMVALERSKGKRLMLREPRQVQN